MKRKLSLCMAALVASTLFASCSSGDTPQVDSQNSQNVQGEDSETPTNETVQLNIWMPWSSTTVLSPSDNKAWQEAAKAANVTIEFDAPPAGQESEAFNLMLASGEYPDIINDQGYRGGGLKAVQDGVYLKLNDYLDTDLPNYKAALEITPEIGKQAKEDDGTIWGFKMIQRVEEPSWAGPAIRKDYLDKLGLDMPETIDDWHNVLTAFKEDLNVEAPMLLNIDRLNNSGAFMGVYEDAFNDFINKNNSVLYGPIEPGFKEWLTLMNQWYTEGLIDQNFATRDGKSEEAYISNGKTGAAATLYYGEFNQYILAGKGDDEDYSLWPAPYPILNSTDNVEDLKLGNKNWEVRDFDYVVSAQSPNIEGALRLMDFWYSDEGFMLGNYGIEGYSYEWVEGATTFIQGADFFPEGLTQRIQAQNPVYTDEILNNEKNIPFNQLYDDFKLGNGAYLRNPLCYIQGEEIMMAMEEWSRPEKSYNMPPLSQTDEESKKTSDIMTPIKTYKDEMVFKFINGDEPLDNFDAYVNQIKAMGIDEVISIKQEQLDRYNNR